MVYRPTGVRIKIDGLNTAFKPVDNLSKNQKRISRELSKKLANKFKMRLKSEIERLPHYNSPRHNTPTPLIQYLYGPKKIGSMKDGVYSVGLRENSRGVKGIWVEEGTKPHWIERPKGSDQYWYHPGAKPRHFFVNAYQRFITKDYGKIVGDFEMELDKRLKVRG